MNVEIFFAIYTFPGYKDQFDPASMEDYKRLLKGQGFILRQMGCLTLTVTSPHGKI